jgi:hypothetical protein
MPKKESGVWVAIMLETGRSSDGGSYEYCGRISRKVFDQLRTKRDCEPLFKLENPFWLDGGSFVFLSHVKDHGFGPACWFRTDSIARLTPLTPAFVKNAMKHLQNGPKSKTESKHSDRRYSSIA